MASAWFTDGRHPLPQNPSRCGVYGQVGTTAAAECLFLLLKRLEIR